MSRRIVGLSGYAGVGKDEARKILCEEKGFVGSAFADKLRELAAFLDPYFPEAQGTYKSVVERLGYDKAKREYPCIRQYLIKLGEGGRDIIYQDVWLDRVLPPPTLAAHQAFMANPQPLVISDVRNPNEGQRVKDLGGIVIRITRPGHGPVHETEAKSVAATKFDIEIVNDGSLDEFRSKVLASLCDK
jgi:hypothetical protein